MFSSEETMPAKILKASWQKHEVFIPNGIETLSLPSLNRQFLKVRTVTDPIPSILRFRVIRGYFSLDFCLEMDAICNQLRTKQTSMQYKLFNISDKFDRLSKDIGIIYLFFLKNVGY